MKLPHLLIALAASLLAANCASAGDLPRNFDPRGVVTVLGREGMAHACPVSASYALTAEHVSSVHREIGPSIVYPLVWGDELGNAGTAFELWADLRRDLSAIKTLDNPYQIWYPLAAKPPQVGDVVWIIGYNFEKGLTPLPVSAKILKVLGGHITYDNSPGPGSSGSCVILGSTGEVVAINVWALPVSYFKKPVGVGVSVWGEWGEVPEQFRQVDH